MVKPFPTDVSPFYERPYAVIHAERIAEALWSTLMESPDRSLYEPLRFVGSVDQLSDNTDFLSHPQCTTAYRTLFHH
ncbi:hypothetical protein [Sulfobacillus thermosulfidooxidans]|uniref:hypothetical protein n=1 Tax=Sulfobacillus thermosulfidooxidans TaxID=28034 RepID=UPI00096B93AD|nr:hypothetical protein [Sulfobacillus thermosulfidooxidans]OLZ11214.1 hypothetical protein BFX05_08005 [Sulfobacillus thermosulfidooxidans]OLZ13447.1 hypothetical protein BFX06_09760 [Sulfobacillus thermosulfidooxidans]OLZ21694.1 hypothetical protein BFX07_12810 [Sulfobacillus thermosulfidooxidans]